MQHIFLVVHFPLFIYYVFLLDPRFPPTPRPRRRSHRTSQHSRTGLYSAFRGFPSVHGPACKALSQDERGIDGGKRFNTANELQCVWLLIRVVMSFPFLVS